MNRKRWYGALSIVVALIPFAFASIRIFRTGYDFRYAGVAFAAFAASLTTLALGKPYRTRRNASVALAATVFVMTSLVAVSVALLIGVMLGPGVIAVASFFGFCLGVSAWLRLIARPLG